MAREVPAWGAPRIHEEALMFGFDIPGRTISRWLFHAGNE
jgi:hypothetical protein